MLTVISGTHRQNSTTLRVAQQYAAVASDHFSEVKLLDLKSLPEAFVFQNEVFGSGSVEMDGIKRKYLLSTNKIVFVMPEYNGGIPGVLKAFIDSFPQEIWHHKIYGLVGVSSGRAGNLRGMDDLTNYMNYMRSVVVPLKIPISAVYQYKGQSYRLDAATLDLFRKQLIRLAQL